MQSCNTKYIYLSSQLFNINYDRNGTVPSVLELATMERPYQPLLPGGNDIFKSVKDSPNVVDIVYLLHKLRDRLYTEALLGRNISGPRLQALQGYLRLLTKYFPALEPKTKDFFDALFSWIASSTDTLQVVFNQQHNWY